MKLKEAYGHPSYNKLIRAYPEKSGHLINLSQIMNYFIKRWLADKVADYEKCKKSWG